VKSQQNEDFPEPKDMPPEKVCVIGSLKWVWDDAAVLIHLLDKIPKVEHYYYIAGGGTDTFCTVYLVDRSIRENDSAIHHVLVSEGLENIDTWWEYLQYSDSAHPDRLQIEELPAKRMRTYDRGVAAVQKLDPYTNDELYLFLGSSRERLATLAGIGESRGLHINQVLLGI
jgi:hypothetical protein